MKYQIVTFETASLAKECGFDDDDDLDYCYAEKKDHYYEDVRNHGRDIKSLGHPPKLMSVQSITGLGYYNIVCMVPTQSLLHQWLLDEHDTLVTVTPSYNGNSLSWRSQLQDLTYYNQTYNDFIPFNVSVKHTTYQEAMETGLKHGLQTIGIRKDHE